MGGRLFWTGFVLTIAYLGGIVALSGEKLLSLGTLELNAIGDFFAGVFAPPAFLWLILGFIQQGTELKASVQSLRLQAKELAASTDQQRQLVEATRAQILYEGENLQHQIRNHELARNPLFSISCRGFDGSKHGKHYRLILSNVGGSVVDVELIPSVDSMNPDNLWIPSFLQDQKQEVTLSVEPNIGISGTVIKICYLTSDSRREFQEFNIIGEEEKRNFRFQRRSV